jgi:hypothetical protein
MLDEMDALMERMLALPVSDLEDELQIPAEAMRHGSLALAEMSADEAKGREEEEAPSTIPLYRTEEPPPRPASAMPRQVDWKLEPPPKLDDIAPPATQRAPLPDLPDSPAPGFSLRRLFMSPLWLVNRTYDACTWWLGPLGRWLRGASCRGMLGFTGLLLLAAACGWVVLDLMGWNW